MKVKVFFKKGLGFIMPLSAAFTSCMSPEPERASQTAIGSGGAMTTVDMTPAAPAPSLTSGSGEVGTTGTDDTSADDTRGSGLDAECDIFVQDCALGLKCSIRLGPGAQGQTVCLDVNGTGEVGDECEHEGLATGIDTCDAQTMCIGQTSFTGGWTGTCRSFCTGTEDAPSCEDPDSSCAGGLLAVCLRRCDPLLQDCQGAGEGCYFNNSIASFQCLFSLDQSGVGESCSTGIACRPGLQCQDGANTPGCVGTGCCAEYCELNAPNTCVLADQGVECVSIEAAEPRFQNVGLCMLP